jgi:hypothetical protein
VFNGQYGLAFGNGIFVAVGYNYEGGAGTIMTSPDGQTWQTRSGPTTNCLLDGIAYGTGRFLAVSQYYVYPFTNTHVLYSLDGTNWTLYLTNLTRTFPAFSGINFVNGNFYATPLVSTGYPTNAYLYNIINGWSKIAPPYPSLYVTGTYSNGLYISVHPGYPLATSPDATNWTVRNTGITNILTGIAYGNNCFVLCTADGSFFRSGNTTPSLSKSKFTTQGFQLSVSDGVGPSYQIQASTDFVHWTNLTTLTNVESSNQFLDTTATNFTRRYYRTIAQ